MPPHGSNLGTMKPLGGGDPVPLRKPELIVGRRPSCDVVLDFENVSGKHCVLRFINMIWHVRDLGSSNGTTVNGAPLSSEHSILPDDELGIAGHVFHIDYDPPAPAVLMTKEDVLDEDLLEVRKKTSLMELAGLDTDGDRPKRKVRQTKAPEVIERLSAEEADFDDALPEHVKAAPKPRVDTSDDDFLKFVEEEVREIDPKKK
jgi:pSer/pThr/pTyr-binding forkhead associated (FHA) protein